MENRVYAVLRQLPNWIIPVLYLRLRANKDIAEWYTLWRFITPNDITHISKYRMTALNALRWYIYYMPDYSEDNQDQSITDYQKYDQADHEAMHTYFNKDEGSNDETS